MAPPGSSASAASSAAGRAPVRTRPRVGLLYTHESPVSREGEFLAKYVGLTLASTGTTSKIAVVGVDTSKRKQPASLEPVAATSVLRADGKVVNRSQVVAYDETTDVTELRDCHVWVLCLDTATTTSALQFVQKRCGISHRIGSGEKEVEKTTPKKRIIVCLQPALRQLRELETAFPKDTVLHGGACFHLTLNKHDVLYPLSHGCFYIERLSAEKTHALYVLDLLEATGFQVLSRKNIQAHKWGHSMIRLFYYINALNGNQTVHDGLRDRAMRLVYLQLLYEMNSLFRVVALDLDDPSKSARERAAQQSWTPDISSCTYLSLHALMVVLPLPNWLFNGVVSRLIDVGLTASTSGWSTIQRDVEAKRETEFYSEFKDLFDLAARRDIKLEGLEVLRNTLVSVTKPDAEHFAISGRGLLAEIPSSAASRAVSRTFLVKCIVTLVATVLLVLYFML